MNIWKLSVLTMIAGVFAAGCAQDVGDIDRTDDTPYFDKTDFEGVWYARSTVVEVPGTVGHVFVGISTNMEKITWEITENRLIAYLSYDEYPGLDSTAGEKTNGVTSPAEGLGYGKDPTIYKGRPILSYSISHFDIQRQYSTSTGEQSNVITENSFDRNWHERKYMRVNWASESMGLRDRWFGKFGSSGERRWIGGEDGEIDGLYTERGELGENEEALHYFDFKTRNLDRGEEISIRHSFMRLPEVERDYEPAFYDDNMMTKFGYFRTQRRVYDRAAGFTDSKLIFLANRHDMWKDDYKRDEAGEYLRDSRGLRIPTPMKARTPKPVIYYLNEGFPDDLLTDEGVLGVASDYDKAYTRAAATVKGMSEADLKATYGDMFVLCHSPVRDTDSDVCDPRSDALKEAQGSAPFVARNGDLRYSFIWWVEEYTQAGLLGFGPSFPDPESGEIVAGVAYVYGAGVDRHAGSGTDIVRFANGEFTDEEIRQGVDKITRNLGELDPNTDPRGKNLDISVDDFEAPTGTLNIIEQLKIDGLDNLVSKPGRNKLIRDTIKESGLDLLTMDDEYIRGMSSGEIDPTKMTDEQFEEMRTLKNPADMLERKRADDLLAQSYAESTMYMADFADDAVIGTALEFKGEKDYEKIWKSIRARIFRGVMGHELGHTVGLRHNFQGTWDSMNFFDEYWDLRKENFKNPTTLAEVYSTSEVTETQANEGMPNYMYSSIMDYHSRFNGDNAGLGKYDYAAILFAYTFGTYKDIQVDNTAPIVAEAGYVEVYNTVPSGTVTIPAFQTLFDNDPNPSFDINPKEFFHSFDDRFAASDHPLATFHYTAVVDILMGGPDNLRDRSIVRYPALRAQQQAGDTDRAVEVQYMFGSDEWADAHLSAARWDLGADALEKTRYYIKNYEEYYPLTHFRRDRLNFGANSVINSAFRSLFVMPQIYQRWVNSILVQAPRDGVRAISYELSALAGLNFLGAIIMKPEIGDYTKTDDGNYKLREFTNETVDLKIGHGVGARLYTRYDNSRGYYWFYTPLEVGNFWDARVAQLALASNQQTQVLGSADGDFRSFAIPYSLLFGEEMGLYVNGMFLNDTTSSPDISADREIFPRKIISGFDFLTGVRPPVSVGKVVGNPVFSLRIYGLISAVASFGSANYSKAYIDQARVFKLGNEEQTLPIEQLCAQLGLTAGCDSETHKLEYFSDPETGIVYGAIKKIGGEFDGDPTTREFEGIPDLGTELIRRGQVQAEVLELPLDINRRRAEVRKFRQIIEDVVLVSDIVKIFDNVLLN